MSTCINCGGSGRIPCSRCKGSGKEKKSTDNLCIKCNGKKTQLCLTCSGMGIIYPKIKSAARK